MIDPAAPAPIGNMGQPIPRYDARAKVTGKAVYAADAALPDVAFACLRLEPDSEGTDQGVRSQSRARLAWRSRHFDL